MSNIKGKKMCLVTTLSGTIRAFFLPQINALADEGINVTVVANDTCDIKNNYLDDRINFIPLNIPRGMSLLGTIKSTCALYKIFNKEKFDYIQYSTPNASACASIAAKLVKCKIRNYHLMGFRYLGETGIKRAFLKNIEKLSCKLSTNVECVSRSNMNLGIDDKVFEKEKVDVIWHGSTGGVNTERFNIDNREEQRKSIREQYKINEREFVFGFVGRITKDKGINELLEAFNYFSNAKLFMVGSNEGYQTLNKKLYEDSLKNKNIIYTGRVNDVQKYFAAFDCLVFPSYREGFGNVVIESQAMGTPVIISNIPGPTDAAQDGLTAITVEPRNSKSLIEAMKKVYSGEFYASPEICFNYVKTHFDSNELSKKVVEQRIKMLGIQ